MMSDTILFHAEDVEMPAFFNESKTIDWLHSLAKEHKAEIVNLNYIFCSDEYLLSINQEYLQHNYYTDIITFPYQQGQKLESDIFISLDRVQENADNYASGDYQKELLRVMAHGLLHLTGLADKTDQDVKKMREAENNAIQSYDLLKA